MISSVGLSDSVRAAPAKLRDLRQRLLTGARSREHVSSREKPIVVAHVTEQFSDSGGYGSPAVNRAARISAPIVHFFQDFWRY